MYHCYPLLHLRQNQTIQNCHWENISIVTISIPVSINSFVGSFGKRHNHHKFHHHQSQLYHQNLHVSLLSPTPSSSESNHSELSLGKTSPLSPYPSPSVSIVSVGSFGNTSQPSQIPSPSESTVSSKPTHVSLLSPTPSSSESTIQNCHWEKHLHCHHTHPRQNQTILNYHWERHLHCHHIHPHQYQ